MSMKEIDVDAAIRFGGEIAKSGMFSLDNTSQGTVIAMECLRLDITPLCFLRTYHMMNGKPTMRADAMLAEFIRGGGTYEIIETTREKCHIKAGTKDHKVVDWIITWADAVAEELPFKKKGAEVVKGKDGKPIIGNQWRARPHSMLFARCVSNMIRKLMPSVCSGIYTPEEVSEFTENNTEATSKVLTSQEVAAKLPVTTAKMKEAVAPAASATVAEPAAPAPAPAPVENPDAEKLGPPPFIFPESTGPIAGKKIEDLKDSQLTYISDNIAKFDWANDRVKDALAAEIESRKGNETNA